MQINKTLLITVFIYCYREGIIYRSRIKNRRQSWWMSKYGAVACIDWRDTGVDSQVINDKLYNCNNGDGNANELDEINYALCSFLNTGLSTQLHRFNQ